MFAESATGLPGLYVADDSVTASSQWATPAVDWGFLIVPQEVMNNQVYHYERGKTLGGSSAQNSMIYNRGTKDCYGGWANATGDASWVWDSLLPLFTRGINYTGTESQTLGVSNAPVQLSFPNFALPFSSYTAEGFREIGVPKVQSLIGGELLDSQYNPFTINPTEATRDSSQASFLEASMTAGRNNLKAYTHSLARKVLCSQNSTSSRAAGVQVIFGNAPPFTLSATKEVIASAGAIQSPQLLIASGIGPQSTLDQYNISTIVNSPGVGQDLWEHALVLLSQTSISEGFGRLNDPEYAEQQRMAYYANQTGEAAQELDEMFPLDWPELEREIASAEKTPGSTVNIGTIIQSLVSPLSRGNISIRSTSMLDPPIIDLNRLSHPTDQKLAAQSFRRMRQLFNTTAIKPILAGEEVPGPNVQADEQILEYIESTVAFNWHAACTCKMGAWNDTMASLDSGAKVKVWRA
ncbi:uncharacterized protein PAC_03285 [Phialocephala subalpina]|uniref:Glucose-methanol-choline oxidoreductase N-terminal domain-containing protein n=1 Tax=Phialocephala subalpina TaxID=576137 RepID=A0A1L7WKW6_9HELO|nr:uncharacterized protein PAC_03285 [Phialocephala subalpina]